MPNACVRDHCVPAAGTGPCTVDIGALACVPPDPTCLQAETPYTAKASTTSLAGLATVEVGVFPQIKFTTLPPR